MNNDFVTAYPTGGNPNPVLLRTASVARLAYALADSEDPRTYVAKDVTTGAVTPLLSWNETLFWVDLADTTSVHDGVTVLVTSDGYRFKTNLIAQDIRAVKNRTTTTPPGSPALGDAYIVGPAATGAWSGKDNDITVYTGHGWQFRLPIVGEWIYDRAQDNYVRWTAAAAWVQGEGARTFVANDIPVSSIIGAGNHWIVENQTTTTPPGSPAVGVQYIVGPAATGAWSGHDDQIAISEDGAGWTFYTPRDGEAAFDKSTHKDLRWSSGLSLWIAGADACVLIESQLASASANLDFVTGLNGTFFDAFEFRLTDVKVSAAASDLMLRVGTGGGPTYDTSGDYNYVLHYHGGGGNSQLNSTTATSMFVNAPFVSFHLTTTAGYKLESTIKFASPGASDFCLFGFDSHYLSDGALATHVAGTGFRNATTPITGIRFLMSSGNIAAGRFSLYGYRKA